MSTTNLVSNPRVLKEIRVAAQRYDVTFLGFRIGGWSDELEPDLPRLVPGVRTVYLSALRRPFGAWLLSSLVERGARLLWGLWPGNLLLTALASNKRSLLLLKETASLPQRRYDLVVAHTLGALYPAYRLASRTGTPFAFDVEDYHPGEWTAQDAANERRRRESLMRRLLPECAYVSYASPLIGRETVKLCGDRVPSFLVNNSFSGAEFHSPRPSRDRRLELVWFSQNIDAGRGLELVIPVLDAFRGAVRLTLIGKLNPEFAARWVEPYREVVEVVPPLPQPELHRRLGTFDVGLAFERDSADFNRHLTLTNKLIAYYQAGLFVLATDTEAQALFLKAHPGCGIVCGQEEGAVRAAISHLVEELPAIRGGGGVRFDRARESSWEQEAEKLASSWAAVFNQTVRMAPA